jgi:hypothetical protein
MKKLNRILLAGLSIGIALTILGQIISIGSSVLAIILFGVILVGLIVWLLKVSGDIS